MENYKVGLLAQRPGLDYEETISLIMCFESVCYMIALVMKLHYMDV